MLAAAVFPSAAEALDEGDWQLGLAAQYAHVTAEGRAAAGLGARLDARYGATDAWSLWGAIGSSWQPVTGGGQRPDGTVRASTGSLGVTFALDVLRVIPFAEAGLAIVDLGGAVTHRQRALGGELALGAEYLLDPRWSFAAVARYQYCPLRIDGDGGARPSLFTLGVRFGRSF